MTTPKGRKLKPKFGLAMPFDEALERFVRTKPAEVEQLIERGKQKKPPGAKRKRKASGGNSQAEAANVVSLRHRRMRKRNEGR